MMSFVQQNHIHKSSSSIRGRSGPGRGSWVVKVVAAWSPGAGRPAGLQEGRCVVDAGLWGEPQDWVLRLEAVPGVTLLRQLVGQQVLAAVAHRDGPDQSVTTPCSRGRSPSPFSFLSLLPTNTEDSPADWCREATGCNAGGPPAAQPPRCCHLVPGTVPPHPAQPPPLCT